MQPNRGIVLQCTGNEIGRPLAIVQPQEEVGKAGQRFCRRIEAQGTLDQLSDLFGTIGGDKRLCQIREKLWILRRSSNSTSQRLDAAGNLAATYQELAAPVPIFSRFRMCQWTSVVEERANLTGQRRVGKLLPRTLAGREDADQLSALIHDGPAG